MRFISNEKKTLSKEKSVFQTAVSLRIGLTSNTVTALARATVVL